MSENNELENFVDRVSTHPNRRKLTIVSQTPTEIIADISRYDTNITEPGTRINASDLQDIVDKVKDLEAKIGQENGSYIYVNNEFQSQVNFTSNPQTQIDNIWDKIYPVGSIYMSVNDTSPASLFGGTWEELKDKFLLGAGDIYLSGATGGEASHTLTSNEIPKHKHNNTINVSASQSGHNHEALTGTSTSSNALFSGNTVSLGYKTVTGFGGMEPGDKSTTYVRKSGYDENKQLLSTETPSITVTSSINNVENESTQQAHNNMPPYLVVNMWKRTA